MGDVRSFIPGLGAMLLSMGLLSAAPALAEVQVVQLGGELPKLRGELLSGRRIVLPDSARGSGALLLLGFTYESRHDVEAWAARFRHDLGPDSKVLCFEVPMISGVARLARPFIDGGMRRGTPLALHERVMTVYGETGKWKQRVGFSEPDVAYLLLVDGEGRLVWRAQGPFGEESYGLLAARIRGLLP
jgi:hypothetical protein